MGFCDFCDIVAKQEEHIILAQDDLFIAVKDIQPDFEFHYQIIPKRHIQSIEYCVHEDISMLEKMGVFASKFMANIIRENLKDRIRYGFHSSEGTSVDHLHMHCIAGKQVWMFSFAHFVPLESAVEQLKEKTAVPAKL